jgi:hypothetical protein
MKKWHFPLINPVKKYSIAHYLNHIKEEIREYEEETSPEEKKKEAMDILHAAETFARKFFANDEEFEFVRAQVIAKNIVRGYYKN